ncbi:MYB7 [Hibiscus syriacus]|uniref:MYB7 n=1 Tax=Hibiscus syriacus TaxID=106335 RepID=A0A6A3B0T9_HIBSY|nr:MYB7 [Hibiscus syriacus]
MATKSLIRNGVLLMNRVFANQFLNSNPIINNRVVNQGLQITPQLFPSLSKTKPSLHLTQNDADSLSQVSSMGFLYPTGLPSLRFLLPDDTLSNYAFDCFEMKWENLLYAFLIIVPEIHQVSQCSVSPREHISLVPSGAKEIMDFSLGNVSFSQP